MLLIKPGIKISKCIDILKCGNGRYVSARFSKNGNNFYKKELYLYSGWTQTIISFTSQFTL